MAGNEDDRKRAIQPDQLALKIKAARRRSKKPNVKNQTGWNARALPTKKFTGGRKGFDRQIHGTTKIGETVPNLGVVINDKYQGFHFTHCRAAGSSTLKTAPYGELDAAEILPPWDSAIDRQIDRPIPVPSAFVE
jgi:hypothetical protein